VYCAIDGTSEPFDVDINDSHTYSDIQVRVKTESSRQLPRAPTLALYKAPKGVIFTELGVTVGAKDKIDATGSLRRLFAETNAIQVIVRPPSKSLLPCLSLFYFRNDILLTFAN